MKKITLQEIFSTTIPPKKGPKVINKDERATFHPTIKPLCIGKKEEKSIGERVGIMQADPIPCKALEIMSISLEKEAPQLMEERKKRNIPKINVFLSPIRSESFPIGSTKTAMESR